MLTEEASVAGMVVEALAGMAEKGVGEAEEALLAAANRRRDHT